MSFSSKKRRAQQGYMLITLMLFVTLLAIASLSWIERVDFQIKRDREEELIHRGVQYSRAIRRYVRKFGHYPARIEELESTNNVRYLRKRYKDPITGKDFKLLHQNDVQMSFNPAAASGLPPGSAGQGGAPGTLNPGAAMPGGVGPVSGTSVDAGDQQTTDQQTADQQTTSDSSSGDQSSQSSNRGLRSFSSQASPNGQGNGPNGLGNGPTFGGMPIMGVASTSKDKSIREFNKKDHYDQWQFIYDPASDRGGLLSTPNQPAIPGATPINQMGGQQNGNPGQGQGFGTPAGGMNSPTMPPPNPPAPNQQ